MFLSNHLLPYPTQTALPSTSDFTASSLKSTNDILSPHGLKSEKIISNSRAYLRLIGTDRVLLSQPKQQGSAVAVAFGIPDTRISSSRWAPMRGCSDRGLG